MYYFVLFFLWGNFKNHIESWFLGIKNCVIGISKIIYISKQDKRDPLRLFILHLYTVVHAGKLCEQVWIEQLIVLIIHFVDSCLRYYHVTLTRQSIGPNKFMKLQKETSILFMFDNIDYNNSEVFILLQVISRKWNESGFRPLLCTYRLNWARRTSWGWWDDWDDTVLQTQDSKFEPWRSEAEHATSRSRRLPTILTFTRGWGRNNFCFFQTAETGNRTPDSGVKGSGANHYPRAPALYIKEISLMYWDYR